MEGGEEMGGEEMGGEGDMGDEDIIAALADALDEAGISPEELAGSVAAAGGGEGEEMGGMEPGMEVAANARRRGVDLKQLLKAQMHTLVR